MVDKRESEHQTCGNKHVFPLDAFDEVQSRFCFLFVKGNQNRVQPLCQLFVKLNFTWAFLPF
jgi:hypothetical protein